MVSPRYSNLTELFTNQYKEICSDLHIPLAPECPDKEKAFGPSTFRTVLGIQFNSEDLSWSISKSKEAAIQKSIEDFLEKKRAL
jgi:hypothetical protein